MKFDEKMDDESDDMTEQRPCSSKMKNNYSLGSNFILSKPTI